MKFTVYTAPTLYPVTLDELRAHLNIDASNAEPAPGAPTVALAGAGAGSVDNGAHRYRVTFVTADGETEGGEVSAAVTVADKTANGKVAVSAIPLGGSAVTSRKLYRTEAAGTTYLLLVTIANNTATTYTDNIADASLGAECPSTNTTGDPFLEAIRDAAVDMVEDHTRRKLLTQTIDYYLDEFPEGDSITLPFGNLASVTSVKYKDSDGTETTMTVTEEYLVETNGEGCGRIVLPYGETWPSFAAYPSNPITVRFVCGWTAAANIPAKIRAAVKMVAADLYEQRGEPVVGASVAENKTVDRLLASARIYTEFE